MKQARIIHPVVDLLRSPDGTRDRQLLYGDEVTVSDTTDGWQKVTSDKDGYVGWVTRDQLGPAISPTHWIAAPATHAYTRPDFKSAERVSVSFGSRIAVLSEADRFVETELGFIPKAHTRPACEFLSDPVSVADGFLGTPYLWGGNSRWGLDCSGLVQAAMLACGMPCPGDSGDQEQQLGHTLPQGKVAQRGDLLFWKGHVAWVADENLLLHANAHHMAVAYEPMDHAIARIKAQGDGPVIAHKRL